MVNGHLAEYKGKYADKSGILMGTGDSLNLYMDVQDNYTDFVRVGVQKVIYMPIDLDYFFIGDWKKDILRRDRYDMNKYIENFFYRSVKGLDMIQMPKGYPGTYYTVTGRHNGNGKFSKDISGGFTAGISIIFEPLQFMLYTGMKKIFLVGCDCTPNKEIFIMKSGNPFGNILKVWNKFKQWQLLNYPDVSIKVVNPVNLKIYEGCKLEDMKHG